MQKGCLCRGLHAFGLCLLLHLSRSQAGAQNVIAWGANAFGQTNVPPSATNVVALAAGANFSLALRDDGSLVSWGAAPAVPVDLPPSTAIAAGAAHCLALTSNGTLVAWGDNSQNQLAVPSSATNVVAICAGYNHSLALRNDGKVVAWGKNIYNQCNVPATLSNAVAIAAGQDHSLALTDEGRIVIWGGQNTLPHVYAKTPFPSSVRDLLSIAAGASHNLALRSGGRVVARGNGTSGQTAIPASFTNGIALAGGSNFTAVLKTDGSIEVWGAGAVTAVPSSATNLLALVAGPFHCLAITEGPPLVMRSGVYQKQVSIANRLPVFVLARGTSYHWFQDGLPYAQTFHPFTPLPVPLGIESATYYVAISNAFGVTTGAVGQVRFSQIAFWGRASSGQDKTPVLPLSPRKVAAGAFHGLALSTNGTVVAWGKNWSGQTNVPLPATNVVAVSAGGDHSLALRSDGSVIAWGRNWDGQTNVPLSASNVIAISAGWGHSLALRGDGHVIAWGNNDVDQTNVPALLSNVTAIAAGYHHNLALRADHTVASWGLYSSVPGSASNVVAIAAGFGHNLVLRADGTVVAWGDNSYGQTNVPPNATNIIGIAAAFYHSLALRADGKVLAWGKGVNDVTNTPSGLYNVWSIAAGEDFNLALLLTGPPAFESSPLPATAHVNGQAIFTAEVRGSQPMRLQWLRNGAPIPNATNLFLMVKNLSVSDAGAYALSASNQLGQTSSASALLTVLQEPFFTNRAPFTNVLIGQSVCLNPLFSGEQPFSYQWRKDGVPLLGSTRVIGVNSPMLCISDIQFADSGDYQLVVENSYDSYAGLVTHLSATPIIGWGDNFAGQLDLPPDSGQVIALAAGDDHTLALRSDGTVAAWGDNTFGQIAVSPFASNVVAIAASGAQSMALTAQGRVLAWGDNRLGLTDVPASATNIIAITTSSTHSLALRADNVVVGWGFTMGVIPSTTYGVAAMAAGPYYTLALDNSGNFWEYSPFQHCFLIVGDGRTIAGGSKTRVVLRSSGEAIYYDDLNSFGGSCAQPFSPTNSAVAAGERHKTFLGQDRIPVVRGNNDYGQTNVPPVATNLVAIASGANHNLGLLGASRSTLGHQTISKGARLGDLTALTATSIGNAPATYQWQFNGTNLPGATQASLVLSSVNWSNAGSYRVIITDAFGAVAGPVIVLNVEPPALQFDRSSLGLNLSSNTFEMRLLGLSGIGQIVLGTSPDLLTWVPILTNPPTRGSLQISLPLSNPPTFYRAFESYPP